MSVTPIYRERFVVSFPTGHRFAQFQRVHVGEMGARTPASPSYKPPFNFTGILK